MILLEKYNKDKANIKKRMIHSSDIFIKARDFYYEHEDMRNEHIYVTKNGEIIYSLYFKKNEIEPDSVFKGPVIPIYVNPYWDYSMDSPNMDFEYIEEHEVYIWASHTTLLFVFQWKCRNFQRKHLQS